MHIIRHTYIYTDMCVSKHLYVDVTPVAHTRAYTHTGLQPPLGSPCQKAQQSFLGLVLMRLPWRRVQGEARTLIGQALVSEGSLAGWQEALTSWSCPGSPPPPAAALPCGASVGPSRGPPPS